MKKKTKRKTKRTPQNAELINKIKAVMLDGSGIRRRIAEKLAMPVKYPRDDGVRYDPAWQDCVLEPLGAESIARAQKILLMLKQRRLAVRS